MRNSRLNDNPQISVVICTRNRAAQLERTLSTACNLKGADAVSWELCVIDNGSSDETRNVVESFGPKLPIRYVSEPIAGLSNARNRGVAEARGRYICWTDDDVELDSGWLAAYASAFERHPKAAVFGGRIVPRLEPPTPRWFAILSSRWPLTTVLAARDLGDEETPLLLEGGRIPWGANFAIRTEEQRQFLYDPNLGVSPNQRRLGEEAEVIASVFKAGATGWWVPDSKVTHIIPPHRQSRRYVREYFIASGETMAYLEDISPRQHHMSPGSAASPAMTGGTALAFQHAIATALYQALRVVRADLRSLHFLRRIAVIEGVQAYRRSRGLG